MHMTQESTLSVPINYSMMNLGRKIMTLLKNYVSPLSLNPVCIYHPIDQIEYFSSPTQITWPIFYTLNKDFERYFISSKSCSIYY